MAKKADRAALIVDAALRLAARDGWRATCLDPEKVKSVCAVPYLTERAD